MNDPMVECGFMYKENIDKRNSRDKIWRIIK